MTIMLGKAAVGLAALGALTVAGAAPAAASNSGTPPGPPQAAGSPANVANAPFFTGHGALVFPCRSNGGGAGNVVVNRPRGSNPNNPHGSC